MGSVQFPESSYFQLRLLDIYRPLPVSLVLSTGTLICCTRPFWSCSLFYLASVYQSLQCLISALTQAGGGGLLFRFASSVALWGGMGSAFPSALLRLPAALCGAGPALRAVRFRVLHKSVDSVGPAFCAFPARAAQAARSLTGALSPGVVCLLPSGVPASVSAHACRLRAPCV